MRRSLILTILAMALLLIMSVVWQAYSPANWQYRIQHVIAIPLLIAIAWVFTWWYKRNKRRNLEKEKKDSYTLLLLGLVIFAISIGSLLIVPLSWPTIGPIGSAVWIFSIIFGVILGLFFVALWMISRQ